MIFHRLLDRKNRPLNKIDLAELDSKKSLTLKILSMSARYPKTSLGVPAATFACYKFVKNVESKCHAKFCDCANNTSIIDNDASKFPKRSN